MKINNSITFSTIILAAGKGTRMKSEKAKVLHSVLGKPMIYYPVKLAQNLGSNQVVVVTGHKSKKVENYLNNNFTGITTALQEPQLGTGHAVMKALPALNNDSNYTLILYGDVPALENDTISKLLNLVSKKNAEIALITAKHNNPHGYGRIIRNKQNDILRYRQMVEWLSG